MSIPFNPWSYTRDAISYGCAIEHDTVKSGRGDEMHSAIIDKRARILAEVLEAELATIRAQLAETRSQLTALMSGEPEVHQLRATIETLKQGTQVLEKQQRELQGQLAAKERECEELRTHLVATANQVQDNCWCAPGDKCPAHAAREYLQESTHATN